MIIEKKLVEDKVNISYSLTEHEEMIISEVAKNCGITWYCLNKTFDKETCLAQSDLNIMDELANVGFLELDEGRVFFSEYKLGELGKMMCGLLR